MNCQFCHQSFVPKKSTQRFCSRSCMASATRPVVPRKRWPAVVAAYQAGDTLDAVARRFACSRAAVARILRTAGLHSRGRGSPRPLDATHKDGRGYLKVKTRIGWRLQHIVVAEEKLGRKLRSGEHAHHANERRDDNRPRNVQVKTRSEHGRHHHTPPEARLRAVERERAAGRTLREIAIKHGVAVSTVHRYLHSGPHGNCQT